jgi:peptidylprolyl isomerase
MPTKPRFPRRAYPSLAPLLAALIMVGAGATPLLAEPAAGGAKSGRAGAVESFSSEPESGPLPDENAPPKPRKKKPAAKPAEDAAAGQDMVTADDAPPPKPKPKPRRRPKPKPKPVPPPPPPPQASVGGAVAALLGPQSAQPAASMAPLSFTDFRPLDAENTLVVETERGRIVVELRPEFAPLAVARVKYLARKGVYNGLLFHRVIDGFVAQTGNPDNHDGGKTSERNLPPEFTFRLGSDTPHVIASRPAGETHGFIGASPYVSVDEARMAASPDHRISAWGAYCQGVMGMGRDSAPDSANSEIFFMRDPARRLDKDYTVAGRVVSGLEVVRSLTVGEPPVHPDTMRKVYVMADLPDAERPKLKVLNTQGPEFRALVDQVRARRGADFSLCDVEVPTRPN